MPLFGQDPHRFGRNKDIDLTKMVAVEYPVNAVLRVTKEAVKLRNKATACHASQGGTRPRSGAFRMFQILEKLRGQRDYFMLDYSPPSSHREKDLFERVK
jgi:hypothetical protein